MENSLKYSCWYWIWTYTCGCVYGHCFMGVREHLSADCFRINAESCSFTSLYIQQTKNSNEWKERGDVFVRRRLALSSFTQEDFTSTRTPFCVPVVRLMECLALVSGRPFIANGKALLGEKGNLRRRAFFCRTVGETSATTSPPLSNASFSPPMARIS